MQPLIMSLSLCLLGFAVCVMIFAASRGWDEEEEPEGTTAGFPERERFFHDGLPYGPFDEGDPTEAFLLRLRNHVRLEHEAAKAFLDLPNAESLHAPTESPLWH